MSSTGVLLSVLALVFCWTDSDASLPSYCHSEILNNRKGIISTGGIIRPAIYCHQWKITGQLINTITISFSQITLGILPDGSCGGNYLKVGKNQIDLCGQTTPYVYSTPSGSLSNSIEVTYFQNSSRADVGFTAQYVSVYKLYMAQCKTDEWPCSDGYCIWPSWRCNGVNECGDGSDEIQCKTTTTPEPPLKCRPGQLKCSSTITQRVSCVNNSLQCNGNIVCENFDILCRPYWLPSQTVCLNSSYKCDGKPHCLGNEDEEPKLCGYTTIPNRISCSADQILCRSSRDYSLTCLSDDKKCDGKEDCLNGEDELPHICDSQSCDKYIDLTSATPYGYITSPGYPHPYLDGVQCIWHFHSLTNDKIQLRFKSFKLENKAETDYVSVFDSDNTYTKHINTYYGQNRPPLVIESTSNVMTVVFHSDSFITEKGFNLTFQNKGSCYPGQRGCGAEYDCYDHAYGCNGIWDCPLTGHDEKNCYMCSKNQYTCGPRINQCYDLKQRCNGVAHCTNMMDELYCTPIQCGSHNGTFLCGNGRCIYETWKCDKTNDCGDNTDEQDCSHITNLIKIAAVSGALICGLLLVVAFGCTCKLYNLRVHGHRHGRHETPLSRLYSEFMRRRAPPPYHEAMLTSRPYDEVRRDYLEHLQQIGTRPPSRRSRRNRNRNQNTERQAAGDGECQDATNTNQNGPPEETQNSVNRELERQNSTSLLLPESSGSSDSETDTENQTESVQVSISEENVVTASYSRSGSQSNKSDSDSETNISPPNQMHPELDSQSVDVCSVDATIASCDSIDDSDKPIDVVVVETISQRRHGSEESLDSVESEDHSFGEFTIAEC